MNITRLKFKAINYFCQNFKLIMSENEGLLSEIPKEALVIKLFKLFK